MLIIFPSIENLIWVEPPFHITLYLGNFFKTKTYLSLVPVAHTCNPSHSGGRDQEDRGLKPARANSL
jgi:hypothetical protein